MAVSGSMLGTWLINGHIQKNIPGVHGLTFVQSCHNELGIMYIYIYISVVVYASLTTLIIHSILSIYVSTAFCVAFCLLRPAEAGFNRIEAMIAYISRIPEPPLLLSCRLQLAMVGSRRHPHRQSLRTLQQPLHPLLSSPISTHALSSCDSSHIQVRMRSRRNSAHSTLHCSDLANR